MPHTQSKTGKYHRQAQKILQTGKHLLSKYKLLSFLSSFVAILVLVLFNRAEDRPPTPENSEQAGYDRILTSDFWYEHTVGEPQPPAKFVAVIMMGKEIPRAIEEISASSPKEMALACKRRIYIAHLLKALSNFAPKVVALDMWFDPASCSDVDSQILWDELDRFSTQVPVVSGLGSYNPSEIRSAWPAEFAYVNNRKPGLRPTELVLMSRTSPVHADAKITEGVVELDSDNRKIPLSWPVYDSFVTVGNPGQPRRVDALPIAAVRAFDPGSPVLGAVGALAGDGSAKVSTERHPYTSFLREEDLPIARAIDVICSSPGDDSWQSECGTIEKRSFDPWLMFNGKIVLVGLPGVSGDFHQSLLGNVSGVILQANYIESLLQNRIYKPLPMIWQIVIGIGWIAAISLVSWRFASHPGLGLFLSLIAVVVPAYLMRLFMLHFHYYTEDLVPLIVAALILNFSRWFERFLPHLKEAP